MIQELIYKLLLKKKEKRHRELIQLRWQQARIERLLAEKKEKAHGEIG